ncbi:MAG: metallophosphoesterase [Clostridiales bacterium]|nr:metallophosphoesterase [Clostridiales bacterium]
MFIKTLSIKIIAFIITLFTLISVGQNKNDKYDVYSPGTCKLNFSILSDSHIEGNNFSRYKVFAKSLQNVKKNISGNDAIVFLGDNTMNGHHMENMLFHGTVSMLLKCETIIPVMGNHDIGNGNGDYLKLQNRWYDYTKIFFEKDLKHPYYYEIIDGYYFIILGMESHEVHNMLISNEQFEWLEKILSLSKESNKPVFVFSHFPANYAVNENREHTNLLTKMLADYNKEYDIFSFVGHTHRNLNLNWSFNLRDGYPEIYLPRLTELTGENDNKIFEKSGIGIEVEIYENNVYVRGRNFYTGEWEFDSYNNDPCEKEYILKNKAV